MQRVVIYSIMGHILSTAEITYEDSRFWCTMALIILLELIAKAEGMKDGVEHILNMSSVKLNKLKDFIDSVARGEERDVNELNEILKQEDKKND